MQLLNFNSNQHKFDAVTEEAKQRKQKTRGTRKDDPYKVYEHLQLSLEEVGKLRHCAQYTTHSFESESPILCIQTDFLDLTHKSCCKTSVHQSLEVSDWVRDWHLSSTPQK